MYRKILIALIIVVLIVLGGLIVFSNGDSNSNTDTKINFLSNKTLQNGGSVVFELTDSKGNVLANQELKIKFTSSSGKNRLLCRRAYIGTVFLPGQGAFYSRNACRVLLSQGKFPLCRTFKRGRPAGKRGCWHQRCLCSL